MNKKKKNKKKLLDKAKRAKYGVRLELPRNKRHKSKKDYKRNNKVRLHETKD